ncbi:MAG: PspC domain-containing protein [Hyphomonadaceae bacterium]|nr:PspC domain-containing protein [Hyphomonadaceae bacterium]
MERVITINLNGNPYQLEEPAYDALRAYVGRAEAALADNPDKAEIVRDLEQAIADKCAAYLNPGKSVVSAEEMSTVIGEMGPVEAEANGDAPRGESASDDGPNKRLYRIRDGAWIAGICTGLAAYLNVDVAIVRLIAVILGFITGGWLLLIYLIAMFIIPSAQTSEEWAAAHGLPFNTQEVIERAKREYARVSEDISRDFRSSWRSQRRAWREQSHAWRRSFANWDHGGGAAAPPAKPAGYVTRVFAGIGAVAFSLITAALLIAFLLAFFTFIDTGAILGWTPPGDVPGWLVLVVIAIAYAAISAPFSALRRASYATVSGHYQGHGADGLIVLAIIVAAAWFTWAYIPEGRELLEQAFAVLAHFVTYMRNLN